MQVNSFFVRDYLTLCIQLSCYLAEPHKYQLRAYIYQARDLLASDADGFSGKLVNSLKCSYRFSYNTYLMLSPSDRFKGCNIAYHGQL